VFLQESGSVLFDGNTDASSIKTNKLSISAKVIRIVPTNDPSLDDPEVALRVELYSCPPCKPPRTTPTEMSSTTKKGTVVFNNVLLTKLARSPSALI